MRLTFPAASATLLLLLVAACGDDPEVSDSDARSATGEVVEGTISDDMLHMDKVRSQSPLLQEEEGAGEGTPATAETEVPAAQ